MFANKLKKTRTPPGSPKKSQSLQIQTLPTPRKNGSTDFLKNSDNVTFASALEKVNKISDVSVHPQSSAEQYWAARALRAETLLSSRMAHQRELKTLSFSEETKRSREIAAIALAYEMKQSRMEKLVIALLISLVSLFFAVVYILIPSKKQAPSRWSLPSHFTIPILSPFTSVVEHETSVIGAKSITMMCMILAILAYFVFRYWLSRARSVG